MSTVFTPMDRARVLDLLLAQLAQDERIAATIVVGSGAHGFLDERSDIDLAAVVADGRVVREVWDDWRRRVRGLLTIWGCSEVTYNSESYLLALMVEGYLEVDLGFIGMAGVVAKRAEWRVAFDRTGYVEATMRQSWEGRPAHDPKTFLSRHLDIWHYLIRAVVALQRGQQWAAVHELEVIRTRAIELACLRCRLDSRHFRAVNALPEGTLALLEKTLPADTSQATIARAIRAAADAFFSEAKALEGTDSGEAARLGQLMGGYLDAAGFPS